VPIVILEISGRNFSWTEAERILDDIEGSLDSPEAARLIESTLRSLVGTMGEGEPPTLNQFGKDIGSALRVRERATWSETLTRDRTTSNEPSVLQATFHPWATDSGIIAAVLDVVDLLFLSVGVAPSPRLERARLLVKQGQSALYSSRASRWGFDQLGSSQAGWSMRGGLERGLLGGSNKASNGLSSERRLSLSSSSEKALTTAEVRRHLFVSHEVPRSPAKGQTSLRKDLLMSLRGRKDVALCISCCRHEAEALEAARFLQAALEPVLEGDCHFTPEDPGDEKTRALLCQRLSSRLLEGVAESRAVLLLQTPSAYTDALTLLELYWAIRQKKTIICLRLQDSPYDFSEVLALSHQSPDRSQY
jgi:hypothetical protein